MTPEEFGAIVRFLLSLSVLYFSLGALCSCVGSFLDNRIIEFFNKREERKGLSNESDFGSCSRGGGGRRRGGDRRDR